MRDILIALISGIILLCVPFAFKFYKKWRQNWYNYVALKNYSKKPSNSFIKYCINYILYNDGNGKD